ncbi:hypothetical protein F5Y18DRAFT_228280 [Xylariaceae sp. FL1019]|nr:hypothetical protein F5Y18DRAFT_228280 [Xylariaceae sp. FL1019]
MVNYPPAIWNKELRDHPYHRLPRSLSTMGLRRSTVPPPMPLDKSSASRRQDSFASDNSEKETRRSGSSKAHSPTVNVYTHCGRHTDQYLFGGHSVSDLWRSFKKN